MNVRRLHFDIAILGFLCLIILQAVGQDSAKSRPLDPAEQPVTSALGISNPAAETPLQISTNQAVRPAPEPTPTPEIGCSGCMIPLFDLSPKKTRLEVEMATWERAGSPKATFSVEQDLLGITTITAKFENTLKAPAGTRYVLWAKSPNNEFIPLAEFTDPPSKVTLSKDLDLNRSGFFITLERSDKQINFESRSGRPSNYVVGVALRPN
jgi:hypothetical protein